MSRHISNQSKPCFCKLLIEIAISTTNNTFGIAFYLKKQKTTQAGKSPIYARITVKGKRIEISVKRSIEDNNWNATKKWFD